MSASYLWLVLGEWTVQHVASSLICPVHPSPTVLSLVPRFAAENVATTLPAVV